MISSDFSNFLTGENIIFFVIYGLIILIAVIIFFIVVRFFIKIIISIFKKIFYREKAIKDQGSDLGVVVNELEESKEERRKIEIQKSTAVAGAGPKLDYNNYPKNLEGSEGRSKTEKSDKQGYDEKEEKDIAEGLSKLKSDSSAGEGTLESKMPSRMEEQEEDIHKKIKIPVPKKFNIDKDIETKEQDAAVQSVPETKIEIKPNIDIAAQAGSGVGAQAAKEIGKEIKKEDNHIGGRIDQLKSELISDSSKKDDDIKERLGVKRKFTDNTFFKWVKEKIRREKKDKEGQEKIEKEAVVISSDLHGSELTYGKKHVEAARKNLPGQNKGIKDLHGQALVYEREKIEVAKRTLQEQNKGLMENVLGEKESDTKVQISHKGVSNQQVKSDGSIFGGEPEVSRIKLEGKMEGDPKIWQAQRQAGLNLSPAERAKLVKEVFSSALGRNISKTDLNWSIKKLNQKMLGTKNPTEHAKIRKEIKFFKKIGGIK